LRQARPIRVKGAQRCPGARPGLSCIQAELRFSKTKPRLVGGAKFPDLSDLTETTAALCRRSQGAQVSREIKRPRNARGRVTQVALRRTRHASILPRLGAHTPFSESPQCRSCIASNSGQSRVSLPRRRMLELSCGGSGGHLSPGAQFRPPAISQRAGRNRVSFAPTTKVRKEKTAD
jgi:hypothetical protein